ncbi:type II toxin-antitoxin system Phd/YefM family antitoxin [Tundrisphaera sp. TA3]|uniref:type II toxin-antitoxin system Phd/YefM family antitoxin n=1 Tax=Tundrisphaera sp. TA3 TaxID=3435775 RepID=UPI003EB96658
MPEELGGTIPLGDFQRDHPEFLRKLKESGRPVILTVDGKPEMVVQDPESYRRLVELAERADRADALQASIDDLHAGRVSSAEEMLAEMRAILAEVQDR